MIVRIQKFGNSKGIILPKQIITMCSIKEEVFISVEDNHIIISPVDQPRKGWEEQFNTAIANKSKQESNFSDGTKNEFDRDEWTW